METEKREKKKISWRLVGIIAAVYFAIVIAAGLIIDGRHVRFCITGEQSIECGTDEEFTDPGVTAVTAGRLFGTGTRELRVRTDGEVDTSKAGTYELTYSARYFLRTYKTTRTVTVRDMKPPVITLVNNGAAASSWLTGYVEEGYSAVDETDGDLTDKVQFAIEDGVGIYTVADAAGNTAVARRELPDMEAPVISLNGEADSTINATFWYSDPGFSVAGGLGEDLSSYVTVTGDIIPYESGSYTRVYSLTNALGETVSAQRTVTVVPITNPTEVTPSSRTIYLTFDDGPGPYTDKLLDVLAKYNVKATFFVTNCDKDYRSEIAREYSEGHTVAVHTSCHDYYTIYASEQAYMDDFNAMEEIIFDQTGQYSKLFRFPGGSSNTVSRFNPGIMSRLTRAMTDMGYVYFDWNVDSDDAGSASSANEVFENVTEGCTGKTYSVVLQHDIKGFSVNAVEKIIVWGLNNGYTFAPLDMTSPGAHHGVNN